MISLLKNEWMKIFQKVSTYLFIVFILIAVIGTAFIEMKINGENSNENWKEELTTNIQENEKTLKDENIDEEERSMLMEDIAYNTQFLDANMNPNLSTNWTYMADWTTLLTSFITLFVVIVCSSSVSSEFADGTIKQLLIRPYKRWKILLSKYIVSVIYAGLLILILLASSYLIGTLLFGNGAYTDKIIDPASLEFTPIIVGDYVVNMFVYWIPGFLVITTLAFMLSTLFKNQSIAVGVSIFILFASSTLNLLIQSFVEKNQWLKFILFPHLDLRGYISESMPMFEGATLGFSLTILSVYFFIFLAVTFYFFQKKDVSY
ncbi:ABC-2 type transport system permease protein [Metabacillus crassostreae]|uniref:ABC transporter permease n=1 Tax=Metabacillus crassostreae TaxID=929098 RepID=UPI00195E2AE7|nr:DUF2705 family protein [Metabacillus crassostreae]MBM7602402.1 ABC-2 type transport system permease protein [Metabacillus crassostreae]